MGIVEDFRSQINNMAAPNRFQVEMQFPAFITGLGNLPDICKFMCKAASVPAETIGQIEIPYHGMTLKVSGDREYPDWDVTVYNTEVWDVRTAFENWLKYIHDPESGVKTSHPAYQTDLIVKQLGINTLDADSPIATYQFMHAWPKNIGEIALDFENTNQIETFVVTFAYQYSKRI
jgi:hypothetical protein